MSGAPEAAVTDPRAATYARLRWQTTMAHGTHAERAERTAHAAAELAVIDRDDPVRAAARDLIAGMETVLHRYGGRYRGEPAADDCRRGRADLLAARRALGVPDTETPPCPRCAALALQAILGDG